MDIPTSQPPRARPPVKVPIKMPVRIPMISTANLASMVDTSKRPLDSSKAADSAGINVKQFCVKVVGSQESRVLSSTSPRSSPRSSSSHSFSSNNSEDSSYTNSSSSENATSGSRSSSVATSSDAASEPTLFQLAENEGFLNDDVALNNEENEITEPIIPPRPPIIRNFPSDLEKAIENYKKRLNREENAIAMKDDNKTVSLGTSKVNYIDPRIICSWAREQNVPINKIFSATLQKKFSWALDTQGFNF